MLTLQRLAHEKPVCAFSNSVSIFLLGLPANISSFQYAEGSISSYLNPKSKERALLDSLDFVVPTVELEPSTEFAELEGYAFAERMSFSFSCHEFAYFGVAAFGQESSKELSEKLGWRFQRLPEELRKTFTPRTSKKAFTNLTLHHYRKTPLINEFLSIPSQTDFGCYTVSEDVRLWFAQKSVVPWLQENFKAAPISNDKLFNEHQLISTFSRRAWKYNNHLKQTDSTAHGIFFVELRNTIVGVAVGEETHEHLNQLVKQYKKYAGRKHLSHSGN
jgi:hypothetical protein